MKRRLCALLLLVFSGCRFLVPAYDNPDSKRYEEEKEKGKAPTNGLPVGASDEARPHETGRPV